MFTLSRHKVKAGQKDHVQVDNLEFEVDGGDVAKALESVEEAFDEIAVVEGGPARA